MAVTSRDLHQQPKSAPVVRTPQWSWSQVKPQGWYVQFAAYMILGFLLLSVLTGRAQVWLDDLRYGRPRTVQVSAYVGHNERPGQPSYFIAMNLNRRVVVFELPGGDSTKARTLQGPYLFGANEDLTPVLLRVTDINNDGQGDLVIAVKNEEIMYINSGDSFRLISDEERAKVLEGRQ